MYTGWSNRKVTRLSDVARVLNSLRGGDKYTAVDFPSCVGSLVLYKALRQKINKKSWEVDALGTCRDKCFHLVLQTLA